MEPNHNICLSSIEIKHSSKFEARAENDKKRNILVEDSKERFAESHIVEKEIQQRIQVRKSENSPDDLMSKTKKLKEGIICDKLDISVEIISKN